MARLKQTVKLLLISGCLSVGVLGFYLLNIASTRHHGYPSSTVEKNTFSEPTRAQKITDLPRFKNDLFDELFGPMSVNNTIYRHPNEVVPRVVYYVIFKAPGTFHGNNMKFKFTHAISLLSAHKFIKPSKIYVLGNWEPVGLHWDWVKEQIPELEHKYMKVPSTVHGIPLKKDVQGFHASDTIRIKTLVDHGGIYMDTDAIVTRPLDELLHYDFVVGRMSGGAEFGNGILLSSPGSLFSRLWWEAYHSYKGEWNIQSTIFPKEMAQFFPHLMRIEMNSFYRPDSFEKDLLFQKHFDWSKNYFMHIWWGPAPENLNETRGWDATIGELFRTVVFGSKELLDKPLPWRVVCEQGRSVQRCKRPTEKQRQQLIAGTLKESEINMH